MYTFFSMESRSYMGFLCNCTFCERKIVNFSPDMANNVHYFYSFTGGFVSLYEYHVYIMLFYGIRSPITVFLIVAI